MKITNIGLYANGLEVAELAFRSPRDDSPYVAKNVLGLDADEIVPNFAGFGKRTNSRFVYPKLAKRELVVWVSLRPRWGDRQSYSELRDDLYRAVASSRTGEIELRLRNNKTTKAVIRGFVKKFEAPHFTETPEVQITLECDDPMLRGPDRVTVDKTFLSDTNTIYVNESTAPAGCKMSFKILDAAGTYFTIKDAADPEWSFTVRPGLLQTVGGGSNTGFETDDILSISSEDNDKYAYIWREPVSPDSDTDYSLHLIDVIDLGSSWPRLYPKANQLVIDTDASYEWDSFTYLPTYWGV